MKLEAILEIGCYDGISTFISILLIYVYVLIYIYIYIYIYICYI